MNDDASLARDERRASASREGASPTGTHRRPLTRARPRVIESGARFAGWAGSGGSPACRSSPNPGPARPHRAIPQTSTKPRRPRTLQPTRRARGGRVAPNPGIASRVQPRRAQARAQAHALPRGVRGQGRRHPRRAPRSPGFDAARGHQGFRDDPHARSPRGPSSGPPSFGRSSPSPGGSVRGGDEFVRPLGLSNLGEHARISNGGGGTHGGDGDGTAGGGWGSNTAGGGWGSNTAGGGGVQAAAQAFGKPRQRRRGHDELGPLRRSYRHGSHGLLPRARAHETPAVDQGRLPRERVVRHRLPRPERRDGRALRGQGGGDDEENRRGRGVWA